MYTKNPSPSPTANFWSNLGRLAGLAARGYNAYQQQQQREAAADQVMDELAGVDENGMLDFGAVEADQGFDEDYGVPAIQPAAGKPCSPCEKRKRMLLEQARRFGKG